MITLNGYKLTPTIFPDKTSQVWKLLDWLLGTRHNHYDIDWRWEGEHEIMQIYQLQYLLKLAVENPRIYLYVPYFPYARQDKNENLNEHTFALYPFFDLLWSLGFSDIRTYDIHNNKTIVSRSWIRSIEPIEFHEWVLDEVQPHLLVFPDFGAYERYPHLRDRNHIILDKKRDQDSGKIVGHELSDGDKLIVDKIDKQKILMIDDICDGGATFISAAEAIKRVNYTLSKEYMYLAVSHGIFSKGLKDLCQHFNDFYTTNSIPGEGLIFNKFEV